MTATGGIGTLNEGALHADLKRAYSQPGDEFEVPLEGFVIDVARNLGGPDELLIEIQTGAFRAMGSKFDRLLDKHRILLVHPIAAATLLHRTGKKKRKSPRKKTIFNLFDELVSMPTLIDHPNLTLEVVMATIIQEQVFDRRLKRGRGGYRTTERRLESIDRKFRFASPADLLSLAPDDLPETFSTSDLAERCGINRALAQKMAYCLRGIDLIVQVSRDKAGIQYRKR